MENNFSLFKRFNDPEETKLLTSLLEENNIPCQIKDNSPSIDITFSNDPLQKEYQVLIQQKDFQKANSLLEEEANQIIKEIDPDYYLFDFSNEELYEILLKKDEWSEVDYILARNILEKRGKTIDDDLLKTLNQRRISDLAQPESRQKGMVIFGYLSACLGGILGIFIGWFLWNYKKTLPDGNKVYGYCKKDRLHGSNIFIIGMFSLAIWIAFRIFYI